VRRWVFDIGALCTHHTRTVSRAADRVPAVTDGWASAAGAAVAVDDAQDSPSGTELGGGRDADRGSDNPPTPRILLEVIVDESV